MEGEIWKSISLTHVQYVEGDLVGYVLAWSSLLPIFIFVSVVTLVLFRRDLHTICFGVGLVANEALNKVLKTFIAEARPTVPDRQGASHHGYGMPSDHSQYMAFFTVYTILFLYIRAHKTGMSMGALWRIFIIAGVVLASAACVYSRFYLRYHTELQVYCGIMIGLVSGAVWFCVVHLVFTPFFPQITSWKMSELLMIRDYTHIPNALWFEYCQVRTESRARLRKLKLRHQ